MSEKLKVAQKELSYFGRGIIDKLNSISQSSRVQKIIQRYGVFFILCILVLPFIVPFIWMLSTSLKSRPEVFAIPFRFFGRTVQCVNYINAWNASPWPRFYLNSAIVTIGCLVGNVWVSSIVAYGFARIKFAGRDILFLLVLSTMMIPWHVTIIPRYILFAWLGWIDTLLPLIVPSLFGFAFYIFIIRQFFMSIPEALADSARIDGASEFRIYLTIFLPLSKPALAACIIFSFVSHWNDYMRPLIYLSSIEKQTVTLGLATFRGLYQTEWHLLMAGSLLALIPSLVVFISAQKYFIRGIQLTGLKM